ncbi:hypothetical protein FP2506_13329 [Fulvimarina pelagi HTCC2506]|uniref:C-type lysozyme inhibitor domain-containing protein n=1 Tax=Fulvimarina pelagi HTCC2506 TaxID=314231 RepID=Q0FXL7_9HYPH|nr:MliC family protein [Fulvimarina pelagi]EAU39719.1 hypothetical protein FP2506_13329 [Fulvimarina pelagi HTCC2506]
MCRKTVASAVALAILSVAGLSTSATDAEALSITQAPHSYSALYVEGASYGGKVRSGPGMQYSQIASTYNGQGVVLIATSEPMDGYNWFQIQLSNGQIGYQWGGLLCGNGYQDGVLADCWAQSAQSNPAQNAPVYDETVHYNCTEGVPMTVRFTEENGQGVAYISHYIHNQLRLPQIVSGSGTQYQSGPYWFGGKGDVMRFVDEWGQTDCYANW